MAWVTFLRWTTGCAVRVAVGMTLIAWGTTHPSLVGLVLMMVGVIPAVTGVAGLCLGDGVAKQPRVAVRRFSPRSRTGD